VNVNPVTFQVIQSRLSGIVREMQDSIFRTGYSTVVRESQDASCVLLDPDGDVVGEHVIAPTHLYALPEVVRSVRRDFGDDIQPGDAFLTNHPYLSGVSHSMDIAVVTPAFYAGELIAFCASIAHKTDLGGVVPGTAYGNAREIFQEGVQYPPIRLERDFRMERDIEAILRANSRTPDTIMGDIRGQVGCARLGERRLADTLRRYGRDDVVGTFRLMQDVAERRLRAALASWPDGVHEAEHFLDRDVDETVRYHVRVTKRGDRIHFDFSASDDQVTSPVNILPPVSRSAVAYALIAMIDPTMPNNGGTARVVETIFRPGSCLNPHFPAPHNSYIPSTTLVAEICIRALAGFTRGGKAADCSLPAAISIGGNRDDGTSFMNYELLGTAGGGRTGSDGPSGIATLLVNVRCAPIEIVESEYPVRVRRWELAVDSGGAGAFRGGLGGRRMWEILCRRLQLTLRAAGHTVATQPVDGGEAGRCARFVINPGTPGERVMPGLFSGVELHAGDVMVDERGGGAGLGDPRSRAFERIVDDVVDGYVTADAAVNVYGADGDRLKDALAAWAGVIPLARGSTSSP
jgi:N-methylhydantoinase B